MGEIVPATSHRPVLPRPSGIRWVESGDSSTGTWVATLAPPRVVHGPSLLLPILVASLIALVVTGVAKSLALGIAIGSVVALLAGLPLLLRLASTVRLSVDREWLEYRRSPFRRRGAVRESSWNIASFAADTLETAARIGKGAPPLRLWGVVARTVDGREIPMRFGLVDGRHAAYVAERLAEVVADAQRLGRAYRG